MYCNAESIMLIRSSGVILGLGYLMEKPHVVYTKARLMANRGG